MIDGHHANHDARNRAVLLEGSICEAFLLQRAKVGNVAVSRHAQTRMEEDGISQEAFDKALLEPTQSDVPDGMDIVWRERDGLRIVIITNPTPNVGAKLVKTVYRVESQASAMRSRRGPLMPGIAN
jgi:Domain of unknown function (DUF4258)